MDWFPLVDRSSLALPASSVISTFKSHGQHCFYSSEMFLLSASDHNSNIRHKCWDGTFRYIYSSYISLICSSFPLVNTHIVMLVTQNRNQLILGFMGRLELQYRDLDASSLL